MPAKAPNRKKQFPTEKARRAFFARKKDGVPEWYVAYRQSDVVVEFHYSPERVAAVKQLRGRFDPDRKWWTIRLDRIDGLLAQPSFPSGLGIVNRPPSHSLSLEAENGQASAWPFSVTEADIAAGPPDLVCRHNSTILSLRLSPRLSVVKFIEKIPGAHLVRADQQYWIPTEDLAGLLKKLRDAGKTFAVAASTAEALKSSALLRGRLIEARTSSSVEDFESAGLFPILMAEGEGVRLHGATEDQLIEIRRVLRSKGSAVDLLNASATIRILSADLKCTPRFWITSDVRTMLENERRMRSDLISADQEVDDDLLNFIVPPAYWGIFNDLPALYFDPESEIAGQIPGEFKRLTASSGRHVVPMPRLEVGRVYGELGPIVRAPRSRTFGVALAVAQKHRQLADRMKRYRELSDVKPDDLAPIDRDLAARLFPHQRVAVTFLRENARTFLADDMGLGKTLSVLSAFSALKEEGEVDLLVVVCPASLIRNWESEAKRWYPNRRLVVVLGAKEEKQWLMRLIEKGSIDVDTIVLNYEAARLDYVIDTISEIAATRATLLCLDESQRVKNHESKTFEALVTLADRARRVVLLSGTPTPRELTDLWAQYRLLDRGERFGTRYIPWLQSVAEIGNKYSAVAVKKIKSGAMEEVLARASEVMLRRKKEDVIHLPAKIFSTRSIPLQGDQLRRYEEICGDLLLRMRTITGKQFVREVSNILEQYLRAVQVASNPRLLDPEWKGTPAKFAELDEIVHEVTAAGQKIVIWTNYLLNVAELRDRYALVGSAEISGNVAIRDRQAIIETFQRDPKSRVLVAVPAAGGVGVTLTAATTAVYVDRTWNAEHWLQSIDRLHRIGQRGTVSIISLCSGGVDGAIARNLERKTRMQAQVLGDEPIPESVVESLPSIDDLIAAVQPEAWVADRPRRESGKVLQGDQCVDV